MSVVPLHDRVLASSYYPLRLAKAIGRTLGLTSPNRLRILLYHDIAPQDHDQFAAQLRWLARSWNFVTPECFASMVSQDEPILGSNLLLTFDDGFASHRELAEHILNPMGIHALFFVVSDLVAIENREEARRFIARNIYMGSDAESLPAHWFNMGWTDLEALLEQGHAIGSHTRSHARLSEINAEQDLESEISGSADTLAQHLGIPIEHFSHPFGNLASFSDKALAVAKRRFRYIHSGLRGDNAGGVSPFALRRDGSARQDSLLNYVVSANSVIGSFLEGAADFHYARACAQLDSWV